MSNHRARPRSGEFSTQKLQQIQDTYADSQEQERSTSSATRSPARSYPAPYSQRSPTALIIDSGGSGDSSSSRGLRVRPADHEAQRQEQQHRRVVSLSWPGEARLALVERSADWDQQLQEMSRRISNSSSSGSSGGGGGGGSIKAADDPLVESSASVKTAAAPNKRQRQMAFSKKRVSSGPIDIPPSPRTMAASATSGRGVRGGALARGDEGDADIRGGRAQTDAGQWYPCYSATRPDDKRCGEGGGPPEHILIWERAVRSGSQQQQAIGAEGRESTRVSEGSTRGQIVGLDDSEAEDEDDLQQMRGERRMSSDQDHGGATVMLFEMDDM
eukprot:g9435.t1